MNLMRGIDLKKIAEKMTGASGAESKVLFGYNIGCMHRGWYVRPQIKTYSRDPGRLRNGSRQGHEEGPRKQYGH
jgi:hypothetical protein